MSYDVFMETSPHPLSKVFEKYLKMSGIRHVDLARDLGVTRTTISRWCLTHEPPLDMIPKIEAIFDLQLGTILHEAGYVDLWQVKVSPEWLIQYDRRLDERDRRVLMEQYHLFLRFAATAEASKMRGSTELSAKEADNTPRLIRLSS